MTDYDRGNSPMSRATSSDAAPGANRFDRPQSDAGAKARAAADDARQQASAVAAEVKEQGKAALGRRKDSAAVQLDAVAGALHETADELYRDDKPQAGRFIDYAADRLESFGRSVRSKDLDALIDDARQMARRSPATFFAGSMAAGFLLARFMKSSADARQRDTQRERVDRGTEPANPPVTYPTATSLPGEQTATSGSTLTS